MAWKKGQSGNPNGRPPKSRTLSDILEKSGGAALEIDGKKVVGRRLLATQLWQAATTATVTFPAMSGHEEKTVKLGTEDWIAIVKFLYAQIDGPPKQVLEHQGRNGGPIRSQTVNITLDEWRARQQQANSRAEPLLDDLADGADDE